MKTFNTVLIEAVVVGVILVILVVLMEKSVKLLFPNLEVKLPLECKEWNKNHIMEITLLISGILFHLLMEYTGTNKWYVDNYYR